VLERRSWRKEMERRSSRQELERWSWNWKQGRREEELKSWRGGA
jgi:hypothetical protein